VSEVVEHDRRRHIFENRMISTIFAAGALIWMCQPSSLTRFDSGLIISGVVAPPVARLNRMPRASDTVLSAAG
jgi:hypothetical protein